jgi:hypothetical protein
MATNMARPDQHCCKANAHWVRKYIIDYSMLAVPEALGPSNVSQVVDLSSDNIYAPAYAIYGIVPELCQTYRTETFPLGRSAPPSEMVAV